MNNATDTAILIAAHLGHAVADARQGGRTITVHHVDADGPTIRAACEHVADVMLRGVTTAYHAEDRLWGVSVITPRYRCTAYFRPTQ